MTGHRANRGSCKHPCRYKYSLVEEKRPNNYYPVAEDSRGLYIFNCKDLALYNWIEKLKNVPIDSLKIEGRMKSIHYIASTVSLYRQLLDGKKLENQKIKKLLARVANRGYTDGFIKGSFETQDYSTGNSISNADSVFVGNVLQEKHRTESIVEVRNNISADDQLEVLSPDGSLKIITMPPTLLTTDNKKLTTVTNSQFLVLQEKIQPFSILRRLKQT
jgi:putative protease